MGLTWSNGSAAVNVSNGYSYPSEVAAWFRAAEEGNIDELWTLAEDRLVSVDFADSRGLTALMIAAGAGFERCVRFLLARNATLDICDKRGWTAVTHAAFHGRDKCLQMLAESGAKLDVRDFLGTTPAMRAALAGHDACLHQLAVYGADMSLKDDLGMGAALHARRNGHKSTARLLKKLGKESTPVHEFDEATYDIPAQQGSHDSGTTMNPTLLRQSGQRIRRLGGRSHTVAAGGKACPSFCSQDNDGRSMARQQLSSWQGPSSLCPFMPGSSMSDDVFQPLP